MSGSALYLHGKATPPAWLIFDLHSRTTKQRGFQRGNVLAPSPFGGMIHKKATVAFLCACRA